MNTTRFSKALLFIAALTAFSACKEIPPFINYSPDIELTKDTCYTLPTVPAKDEKNVLIEDVSGVRCVNCPEAAEIAHTLKANNPGRVFVATLHPTSNANLTTAIGNDTFNTQEAENIFQNLIGGAQGLPTGAVDRKLFSGETKISVTPNKWQGYAQQQLQLNSDVNLELHATSDAASRVVKLDVKTTFTENDATPNYLTIMVLESGIVQPQITRSGQDDSYIHNEVLRYTHTNYSGLLLASEVEAGRVCEKSFELTIPEKYDFSKVTVLVMVNKVDEKNKQVLQVDEIHLSE